MGFNKIKAHRFLHKFRLKTEMIYWLYDEKNAGDAFEKIELLGFFLHHGQLFYAAKFSMKDSGERPAGEYIIVEDEYGTVMSLFLEYNPETALDDAKTTADAIFDFREKVKDPMFAFGFSDGMPESYKKTPEDIARRAMAYLIADMAWETGEGIKDGKYSALLDEYGLRDNLLKIEKHMAGRGIHMPQTVRNFNWQSEAVFAILWASGLYTGDVCCNEEIDVYDLYESVEKYTVEELAQRVVMKNIPSVIESIKELYSALENDEKDADIAFERIRGLLWLFNDAEDWTKMAFCNFNRSYLAE